MGDHPLRMTISEVAGLARCSVSSIHRRRKVDPAWLPAAPVQIGRRLVFERAAVFKALGMTDGETVQEGTGWEVDPVAYREALAREVRERAASRRRNVSRPVRNSAAPKTLRLVADNPTS